MTGSPAVSGPTVPPAFPRIVVGVAWVLTAAGVGTLGWLVFALSDRSTGRVAGVLLMAVALFGAVTAVLVLTGRRDRRLSLAASAVFVLAGVTAAVLVALDDRAFLSDVLLLGGVPVACGVGTALLAMAGRR